MYKYKYRKETSAAIALHNKKVFSLCEDQQRTVILTFLLLPMHYEKDIEKLDRRNSYANHVINN